MNFVAFLVGHRNAGERLVFSIRAGVEVPPLKLELDSASSILCSHPGTDDDGSTTPTMGEAAWAEQSVQPHLLGAWSKYWDHIADCTATSFGCLSTHSSSSHCKQLCPSICTLNTCVSILRSHLHATAEHVQCTDL